MTTFAQALVQIEARPTPTPKQYADARHFVTRNAPDCIDAIFGDDTKEN